MRGNIVSYIHVKLYYLFGIYVDHHLIDGIPKQMDFIL